jgi:hypothetical protein
MAALNAHAISSVDQRCQPIGGGLIPAATHRGGNLLLGGFRLLVLLADHVRELFGNAWLVGIEIDPRRRIAFVGRPAFDVRRACC